MIFFLCVFFKSILLNEKPIPVLSRFLKREKILSDQHGLLPVSPLHDSLPMLQSAVFYFYGQIILFIVGPGEIVSPWYTIRETHFLCVFHSLNFSLFLFKMIKLTKINGWTGILRRRSRMGERLTLLLDYAFFISFWLVRSFHIYIGTPLWKTHLSRGKSFLRRYILRFAFLLWLFRILPYTVRLPYSFPVLWFCLLAENFFPKWGSRISWQDTRCYDPFISAVIHRNDYYSTP